MTKEDKKAFDKDIPNDLNVLALCGEQNTGKSTSLQKLITLLKDEKELYCRFKKRRDELYKNGIAFSHRNGSEDVVGDFVIAFEYKGKKIGIITAGDSDHALISGLHQIIHLKCDLYVCASHPSGSSFQYLKRKTKNGNCAFYNKEKNTPKDTSYDAAALIIANALKYEIRKILGV